MNPARNYLRNLMFACLAFTLFGCAATKPIIPVDTRSVKPGETVTRGGETTFKLLGTPVDTLEKLPHVNLIDTNLKIADLSTVRGKVLLISIVPSLDTRVCERQTSILGEKKLSADIQKISISRDLPYAQQRFAEETGFKDILYLSDFQKAQFGMETGLLVDKIYLLARAMMVVDRGGHIRYLQVVPELSHMPDMDAAFAKAEEIAQEK